MKSVLVIGYHRFLVPTKTASKVLEMLCGAVPVEDRIGIRDTVRIESKDVELSMSILSSKVKFVDEEDRPITTQEVEKKQNRKGLPSPRLLRLH